MNTQPTTARSLVRKLADVMKEVVRVPKNGRNDFHKYDYVTEADLVEAIRSKLAEKGIFVFTSTESTARQADITEVFTLHTFVDGETGEEFRVQGYGQGQDKGDKGGYKAMTGAMKYMLMKNFLISTGDDPEHDSGKMPQAKAPAKKAPEKPQAKQPPTKLTVLETLAHQTFLPPLHLAYNKAFAYPWSTEEAKEITDCFLDCIARLAKWKREDGKFFGATGLLVAHVEIDGKTGKASVNEIKSISETELKGGKQIERVKSEAANPAA